MLDGRQPERGFELSEMILTLELLQIQGEIGPEIMLNSKNKASNFGRLLICNGILLVTKSKSHFYCYSDIQINDQ